ncbi:MAG TPA: hypothetical protein VFT75_10490, partial [Nocardioidaceae bacterium]|nr:hypothetical protein [Nocardioidaceae bacterium]
WDWRREEHRNPAQTSVDARWVPFSQVQGITLDVSRVEPTERKSDGSHYGLQFSDSWTILLAGGEPLRLTADQSEDAPNRLRTFVGRVRSAL